MKIDAQQLAKEIADRMAFDLDVNDIATGLVTKFDITQNRGAGK